MKTLIKNANVNEPLTAWQQHLYVIALQNTKHEMFQFLCNPEK